ncbi:MAG: hypothetical protein ACM30G_01120 [Micromonosporaceae bacterium]
MKPTGRLAPGLAAAALALIGLAALLTAPAAATPRNRADYVIIAGAPGLRWDDVTPSGTPALWRLAENGSIGALAVRSARRLTCPADGWLTLGAGNLAQRVKTRDTTSCPSFDVPVDRPDGIGGFVRDQQLVVRENEKLPWGARPGALAESVRCTVAVGRGAAVAAARPIGRVDRYAEGLPDDPADLLSQCVLSIVDLGEVVGTGPARATAVARVEAQAARVLDARPERSLVLVAGLADTEAPGRLHVVIADGPGYDGGWLASASTSRSGYLQLFDIAATALAALGKPRPGRLFAGYPAGRLDGRPDDLAVAVDRLADADGEAIAQRRVATGVYVFVVVAQVLLLAATIPLLRRARPGTGPLRPPFAMLRPPRWPAGLRWLARVWSAPSRRLMVRLPPHRLAEVLLVAAALAVPAALAADVVPWWRSGSPGLLFTAVWLSLLAVATAGVVFSPLRRHTLGPTAGAAALAAVVVMLDVLGGGRLQLNGVAGYSALDGGRFAGLGVVGLGVVVAGVLIAAGCLAQQVARSWRAVLVAGLGCLGVIVVGSPYLGSDAAGAVALTAGVGVAAVLATGGWLTLGRIVTAVGTGLAATAAFALLDYGRDPQRRGSLGQFVAAVRDGTAGALVSRASAANVLAVATSPLTVLAAVAAVFIFFVLLQPWGGLKRLFGVYPALRAAAAGLAVAALLGGILNGAGFTVAGAAAATALPLVTLASLRALAHADERTLVASALAAAAVSPAPGPTLATPGAWPGAAPGASPAATPGGAAETE